MKAGALAAWEDNVAFLAAGCRFAGVNDGDSTFKDFLELDTRCQSVNVLNRQRSYTIRWSLLLGTLEQAVKLYALTTRSHKSTGNATDDTRLSGGCSWTSGGASDKM